MKTIFKNFFSHPSVNLILSFFLLIAIAFSIIWIANAAAPNPGHIISEIGNVVQGDILYGSATDVISVLPKSATAGQFLSNSGASNNPAWATPAGGSSYRTLTTVTTDVINNNATANTLATCTGLSFTVVAGTKYRFYALIWYKSAATTTGSRWTITGPASPTSLAYTSQYFLTATTQTLSYATAYSIPATSNATSALAGNNAIIRGFITPSAAGTVAVQFASEVANSAITCKAGSTLEWW